MMVKSLLTQVLWSFMAKSSQYLIFENGAQDHKL